MDTVLFADGKLPAELGDVVGRIAPHVKIAILISEAAREIWTERYGRQTTAPCRGGQASAACIPSTGPVPLP